MAKIGTMMHDHNTDTKEYILAITGASGFIYGMRLFERMWSANEFILHVILSEAAKQIMAIETDISLQFYKRPRVRLYQCDELDAPISSGSYITHGMIIVPCSMGTIGAIANGVPQNLIHRAADVCLKEGRMLILVPRETPLSQIHLANMLKVSQAGGIILPAMPAFYQRPGRIEELVDTVVDRIIDQIGLRNETARRWGSKNRDGA